jgi:hypothetical protein
MKIDNHGGPAMKLHLTTRTRTELTTAQELEIANAKLAMLIANGANQAWIDATMQEIDELHARLAN